MVRYLQGITFTAECEMHQATWRGVREAEAMTERRQIHTRRSRVAWAVTATVLAVGLLATPASADDVVTIEGDLDGNALADSGPDNPVEIDPNEQAQLNLEVTNTGGETVTIGHVRLVGTMLGITFLGYDVTTNFSLDAGETRSVTVPVDLFDLDGQGHGFLRSEIRVYTPDREQLGATGFATDIRGRPLSTMGLFAILLLVITAGTAAANFIALTRRRLPASAFTRGTRFAVTGLGLGLLLAVAFSVLRIFPLPSASWVPMILIPTLIGFGLGFISPGPELEDDDDTEDDLLDLTDDSDLDLRTTTTDV